MGSYSATFNQRVENELGDVLEASDGVLHLKRPRALLWQTYSPFPVIVSTTDTHVRIYDQDLAQVTEIDLDDVLSSTPAGIILTAGEQLTEAFEVAMRIAPGTDVYTLTPKADNADDAEFVRVEMAFDDIGLTRLNIEDALGNRTRVAFYDRRVNERLAAEVFEVAYPDDIDWARQ